MTTHRRDTDDKWITVTRGRHGGRNHHNPDPRYPRPRPSFQHRDRPQSPRGYRPPRDPDPRYPRPRPSFLRRDRSQSPHGCRPPRNPEPRYPGPRPSFQRRDRSQSPRAYRPPREPWYQDQNPHAYPSQRGNRSYADVLRGPAAHAPAFNGYPCPDDREAFRPSSPRREGPPTVDGGPPHYHSTYRPHRATGGARRRPRFGGPSPHARYTAPSTSDPDPDFSAKVRVILRVIKVHHHLMNVSTEQAPVSILKLTANLAAAIKPAAPNPATLALIEGNARFWEYSTMLILRDHYKDTIANDVQILKQLLLDDWQQLFEVACSWARRHFGRRLNPSTLQQVHAMLTQKLAPESTLQFATAPPSTATVPSVTSQRSSPHVPTCTADPRPDSRSITVVAQLHPPPRHQLLPTPGGIISDPDDHPGDPAADPLRSPVLDFLASPPPRPCSPPPPPPLLLHSPILSPLPSPPPSPTSSHLPSFQLPTSSEGPAARPLPCGPPPLAPRSQRAPEGRMTARPPLPPAGSPGTLASRSTLSAAAVVRAAPPPLLLDLSTEEIHASPLLDPITAGADDLPGSPQHLQVPLTPTLPGASRPMAQSQLIFTRPASEPSASTPTRRPTRHINTGQKLKDWSLTTRHKWVIIGDSNVGKIPPFQEDDLQVDAFPGATFRHAEAILAKTTLSSAVRKVVLAFGLNNRSQKVEETTIKQLQKAVKVAKVAFPLAQIYVPLINFSRALPRLEQANLCRLNKYIAANCNSFPELPMTAFTTDSDQIHWSHSTAKCMYQHWVQLLK